MKDDRDPVVKRLNRLWIKAGRPTHRDLSRRLTLHQGIDVSNTTISNYMAGKCPPPERMDIDLVIALTDELGGKITEVSPVIAERAVRELERAVSRERFLAERIGDDADPALRARVLQIKSLLLWPVELAALPHPTGAVQMEMNFDDPPELTVIDLPAEHVRDLCHLALAN